MLQRYIFLSFYKELTWLIIVNNNSLVGFLIVFAVIIWRNKKKIVPLQPRNEMQ
jgi:hypothetical protein